MVLYGLTLTPLAASLRKAVPLVVQPWYANNAAMAGPMGGAAEAMRRLLIVQGLARGYYPELDKSIFISSLDPATNPGLAILLIQIQFQVQDRSLVCQGLYRLPPGATQVA
jgi:hypothetical protein